MVILADTFSYLSEKDFPNGREQEAIIADCQLIKNRWDKDELQMQIVTREGNIRNLSVYGENLIKLKAKFSKDTDTWLKRTIFIALVRQPNGKLHRVVRL
jgi:hypothetical protein